MYILTLIWLITANKVEFLDPFNLSDYNFSIYSGYLPIVNQNQSFHYMLVESKLPKTGDVPLILWLNGGPGCSSMIGFLQEIGPFVFMTDDDFTLQENPYSWNSLAHLLFLESPSAVGFSQNPLNISFNDTQTAQDNLMALQEFYSNYPEYQKNPLWIAGESYAGVYIPLLAMEIDQFNQMGVALINLQGMLIGNGVTNLTALIYSELLYLKKHQLLPPKFDITSCQTNVNTNSCNQQYTNAWKTIKRVNPYNIYSYCYYANQPDELYFLQMNKATMKDLIMNEQNTLLNHYLQNHYDQQFEQKYDSNLPCIQIKNMEQYLNNEKVKANLFVDSSIQWKLCANKKTIKYKTEPDISIKTLKKLTNLKKYQILIYNGDADSIVPWNDNLQALQQLNLTISEEWHPYYVKDKQLGGFTQAYDEKVRFITIRGSGHMVPFDDRETALYLLNQTLFGLQY